MTDSPLRSTAIHLAKIAIVGTLLGALLFAIYLGVAVFGL